MWRSPCPTKAACLGRVRISTKRSLHFGTPVYPGFHSPRCLKRRKPPQERLSGVAGAGFEPATFGL
jgi:hypothetical protein